jgi:hypothetical protein
MDQAVLVKSDRDIGAKVIEALSRVNIPVSLLNWAYVPELEECNWSSRAPGSILRDL